MGLHGGYPRAGDGWSAPAPQLYQTSLLLKGEGEEIHRSQTCALLSAALRCCMGGHRMAYLQRVARWMSSKTRHADRKTERTGPGRLCVAQVRLHLTESTGLHGAGPQRSPHTCAGRQVRSPHGWWTHMSRAASRQQRWTVTNHQGAGRGGRAGSSRHSTMNHATNHQDRRERGRG